MFEPFVQTALKWLSLKTVLLAVATVKKICELHTLSLSPLCLQWGPDDVNETLRPNPAFLLKVLSLGLINQSISLVAYTDQSDSRRQISGC